MRLRRPLNYSNWLFFIEDPEGNELRLPATGHFKNKQEAVTHVTSYINHLAESGHVEYKNTIIAGAGRLGISVTEYSGLLIEHQLCLRNKGVESGLCYNSGFGDTLHQIAGKVDTIIAKAPAPIQKAAKAILSRVLPKDNKGKPQVRAGGCSRCGGTRTFTANKNNLGRASNLNKYK